MKVEVAIAVLLLAAAAWWTCRTQDSGGSPMQRQPEARPEIVRAE